MRTTVAAVIAVLLCLHREASSYRYIRNDQMADQYIQSESYPEPYPKNENVTWEWDVPNCKWRVIFEVFSMDRERESSDKYDRLEITDRRNPKIYDAASPPLGPYTSEGQVLIIQFISDGLSDHKTNGFKLHIIYGSTDTELHKKTRETNKLKTRSQEVIRTDKCIVRTRPTIIRQLRLDYANSMGTSCEAQNAKPDYSLALLIILPPLVIFAVVIAFFIVLSRRTNQANSNTQNRNIFGVRRDSGISHSRRTRSQSSDETRPDDVPMVQLQHPPQLQQQQRTIERAVQRSNSQLNWMARAELATTTLQKAGYATRPNKYTKTDELSSSYSGSAKMASGTACKTVSSPCAVRSLSASHHVARSCESNLNEYCETADSLHQNSETLRPTFFKKTTMNEQEPPAYEKPNPSPLSIQCIVENPTHPANCYDNVVSIACPGKSQGNHTNIYINTRSRTGSSCSINEITIDAKSCTIKSKCCDRTGENSTDKHDMNDALYRNAEMSQQRSGRNPSSSSVQIIDGYAFIVPSSNHRRDLELCPPSPINEEKHFVQVNGNVQETSGSSTEASHTDHDQGSIDPSNDVYINLLENNKQ